ncbi:hypothetical protein KP509_01G032400 [Ceratopteris richardii]|nr:hypothetical protein KP509_01G032400 [Ceratopteris richardii]
MLEEQSYGSAHLRVQPPPICVSQVKHMRERDLPGWGNNVQNLEEWEQLSQEPDIAADEDSHILGLRDLSLNTSEQEKVESDKDDKFLIEQEAQVSVLQQETVDNSQSIVRSDHVEDASIAVKGDKEDNTSNLAPVSDNSGHAPADAICEEKEQHKFLNLEEQENLNGDGWQRAVSRSTRRKHEKRAARVSTNASIKGLAETECFEKNEEGETVPDGTQDILDEDKSDGDHQCISETYVVEENGVPSCRDTESEASWALCPISHSKVACITADFPMQNVLLQIGLRVVSPNGVQIQQIHRWALKCEACRNVTTDVRRIFCPKCGNGGTLYKVSITTGPNGVMHTGTRKRFNIRGTKYSLPLPKGGRQGVLENPILREDQLPKKLIYPKKKALNTDFSAPAEMFEIKAGRKEKTGPPVREALAIFSGKRNPNRPRPKLKG